ncbi:hypothetical protein B0T16DRAFT_460111 [Cercophora newfieldiana]|uniref:Uncharacterized protein n=1 Tax=Cercophora newfieldiana TaxID=92897 RepID=A0AA39Y3U7_9PEZI|nr:hypothetical protein B0T16DRAFT_460111 [Cercophora newfieldiana]
MGIEDVLLNMDMGWTDTAHHQPHRAQFFVNNITTTLSSLIAAPTQLMPRGSMVSFAQSAPFVELFRRGGILALGRVVSVFLGQVGRLSSRWPSLLRPSFWLWVLMLGMKSLFFELWLSLYLVQHYRRDEGRIEWKAVWRDVRQWSKRDGPTLVGKVVFPIWVKAGYLVTALKVSGWSLLGWSPSASLVCAVVAFAGVLGIWYFVSDQNEDEKGRRKGFKVRFDCDPDSAESTSDEGRAQGKGAMGLKRRPKARRAPKKKKNTTTF